MKRCIWFVVTVTLCDILLRTKNVPMQSKTAKNARIIKWQIVCCWFLTNGKYKSNQTKTIHGSLYTVYCIILVCNTCSLVPIFKQDKLQKWLQTKALSYIISITIWRQRFSSIYGEYDEKWIWLDAAIAFQHRLFNMEIMNN